MDQAITTSSVIDIDLSNLETSNEKIYTELKNVNNEFKEFKDITLKFYDFLTVCIVIIIFLVIVRVGCGIFK